MLSLWNIVRDFFVQYIFGGYDSEGTMHNACLIGGTNNATDMQLTIGNLTLSLSDWLASTLTIITMLALCVFLYLVVRWVFRLVSGLIR